MRKKERERDESSGREMRAAGKEEEPLNLEKKIQKKFAKQRARAPPGSLRPPPFLSRGLCVLGSHLTRARPRSPGSEDEEADRDARSDCDGGEFFFFFSASVERGLWDGRTKKLKKKKKLRKRKQQHFAGRGHRPRVYFCGRRRIRGIPHNRRRKRFEFLR